MTQEELLLEFSKIADCELNMSTEIPSCADLDSLALLNIYTFMLEHGMVISMTEFIKCVTIGQIIEKALKLDSK